ncbi:integrase, partial [Pseudomonas aeruginosa]
MPTAIEFIADRLPRVTVEDVRRFADTVEIRDATAFAAELQAFVHERVEAVTLPANLEGETVGQALARKAAALRADTRWAPNETDVQRGRALLLEAFNQP